MKNRLCLIYNYAQHYRSEIFRLMDRELNCDFVFGDRMGDVKKLDYSILGNFKKEVKNKKFLFKPLTYQKGVIKLLREPYSKFIMLGDVHCISTWIMLVLIKIIRKKKIFLWSHGWYGRESLMKTLIKKVFFNMADGTFLYGNYARELMIKEGCKASKLFVIYNSLSYDAQVNLRRTLRLSSIYNDHFRNDFFNLIFVGRLTGVKRLDLLLDSLAILESQSHFFNLTLIGDGIMNDYLKTKAKQLGLKRVWFYGATYDEKELSELIFNADLCVSPGNVGLTAIHSMTYGTPVLTHNNFPYQMPEFEAIIDGVTGTFFEYENSISLADNIKRWFLISPERELIRKHCLDVVDSKYNPHVQIEILKKHLI